MKSYYTINTPIITGIFLSESKHRFLCIVLIGLKEVECFIPCSSHLEHFIDLVGRKVLLTPNKQPNARTPYAVLAVKYNRHNILLNTSLANKAIYHYFSYNKAKLYYDDCLITCEKLICGYKSDLFIEGQSKKEIVEVKSIISVNPTASFPTIYSGRAIKQLEQFLKLPNYFEIQYCLISLSPYIKEVYINKDQTEYYELFYRCLNRGMKCKAYFCSLVGNKIKIINELPVIF